jgi:hypothetical protein
LCLSATLHGVVNFLMSEIIVKVITMVVMCKLIYQNPSKLCFINTPLLIWKMYNERKKERIKGHQVNIN